MRRIYISLLFIAVLSLCIFCFLLYRSYKQRTDFPPAVGSLRIANINEFSIFDLFAQKYGFFRKNGLDVHIRKYESGPPAVSDLLGGTVDIAVASDYVGVNNIFSNTRLRILTQANTHQIFHLLARADKGITSIPNLRGKKIGVTKTGAGEFYLVQFLILNRIPVKEITLVDLTPLQMTKRIETGELDAIVIFDPHAFAIKERLGKKIISWSLQEDQYTFALVYTTDTFITEQKDLVMRYMRALLQAEEYFNKNPAIAKKFIAEELTYSDRYIEYIWPRFSFMHSLNQELLLTMENQARFLIGTTTPTPNQLPNYLDYIYFEALDTIKPERITIVH